MGNTKQTQWSGDTCCFSKTRLGSLCISPDPGCIAAFPALSKIPCFS
jgi:hypothetical protein